MEETAQRLVAKIGEKQVIKYTITPEANSLFPAESIGGQLTALSELFMALGKADGLKLKVMVSSIVMDDFGSIKFELVVVPVSTLPQHA